MIVRLTGGLGNQMFGYAFGRALSLRHNETVYYHWCRSTWDYALDAYSLQASQVRTSDFNKMYQEPDFSFDPKALEQPVDTYFAGYWQSPLYFKDYADVIKQDFAPKQRYPYYSEVEKLADKMRDENSVFVHVRRGDYTNPGTKEFHGILPWEYYRDAKRYIKEKINSPKFYFFSDQPEWVREHFYTDFSLGQEEVISGFNQHDSLYLMQACRHGIGANSSFSWWANWLADYPGRVNITPRRWFTNPDINTNDLFPEHWVRL